MITKQDVELALTKLGIERYRTLAFRHPDVRHRASWQAIVIQLTTGATRHFQKNPPEELLRQTPAGAKIPADESPLIQPVRCCGPGGCAVPAPTVYLTEDAEE